MLLFCYYFFTQYEENRDVFLISFKPIPTKLQRWNKSVDPMNECRCFDGVPSRVPLNYNQQRVPPSGQWPSADLPAHMLTWKSTIYMR